MAAAAADTGRWNQVIDKIVLVDTPAQEGRLLESLAELPAARTLGFVNAHAMNLCAVDPQFAATLAAADLLLRDGIGMALLYRKLRLAPGLNMNGTDLIPKIIAQFRGRRAAFWGTTEPFLGKAADRCRSDFEVEVISTADGFQSPDHYIAIAHQQRPDLIVLGMGMPKQERLAMQLRSAVSHAPLIVCGGAILDFLGGKVPRAPEWIRSIGMEWLYRLAGEPRRLFQRYVLGNPIFLMRLIAWRGPRPTGA
ncbi:MAG: WecB/TagA/CpsF family glycosyltransferase [Steroidobacteraceae bacterium]